MVRCFFLLSHFLVVKDYELSKSTSHLLGVALTLKCIRILSWSISFFSTSIVFLLISTWQTLNSRRIILKESSLNSILIKLMVMIWLVFACWKCPATLYLNLFFTVFKNSLKCGIFWSISFFSTSVVFFMMLCVRLLSELMILLSTHHVTNHLTCRKKLR